MLGTARGYVIVGGTASRPVYAHRVVAQRCFGRPLRRNEVVHHVNLRRDDNRPENLQVATRSQHSEAHMRQRRRLAVLIPGLPTLAEAAGRQTEACGRFAA